MNDNSEQRDAKPDRARAAAAREERLAQALRANLKRRKDQGRGRSETAEPQDTAQNDTR